MPLWVAALAIVVALFLGARLSRMRVSLRTRSRARVAVRGEARAARLLERAGYTIEARSAARASTFVVDGEPVTFAVRADLLARCHAGHLHVVEVKTGRLAPDPLHGPTRRQLLEYALVFGTPRVLLVDMAAEEIHEVGFPDYDLR